MSLSSVMYQGLQSCLEPSTSADAGVLKLKSNLLSDSVSAQLTNSSSPVHHQPNEKLDMGGWSFLQSLSQPKESSPETQNVYVHPLTKRSASTLSKKSLEMCTESLGSETGSTGSSDLDDICSLSFGNENGDDEPAKMSPYLSRQKTSRNVSFPPPLTSMSCSHGVHMRPHREGGRLILQAVSEPSPTSYFRAERSDGRLRLQVVIKPVESEAEPEELAQAAREEDHEEEEEEEEESLVFDDDEGEGNVKFTMEKLSRRAGAGRPSRSRRCNQVGLTELGREPFWVAT